MKNPHFITVFLEKWLFWYQKGIFWAKNGIFGEKNGIFSAAAVLLFRLRVAVGKIPYMTWKPCVYK